MAGHRRCSLVQREVAIAWSGRELVATIAERITLQPPVLDYISGDPPPTTSWAFMAAVSCCLGNLERL